MVSLKVNGYSRTGRHYLVTDEADGTKAAKPKAKWWVYLIAVPVSVGAVYGGAWLAERFLS